MITKSYAKNGQSCRVTFQYAPGRAARSAAVLGEFNDWRPEAHPMERRDDGTFHLTVSLPAGRRYRFRYLFDGESWANDEGADAYVRNQFGSEDAVLDLESGGAAPAEGAGSARAGTRAKAAKTGKAARSKAGDPAKAKAGAAGKAKPAKAKAEPASKPASKAAAPKAPAAPATAGAEARKPRRRRAPAAQ